MSALDNRDIAALFDEMAELLSIRGGEPHRARAFRRVARIVERLAEPVERLLAWGTLARRRGIGEGTLLRLRQILATGTCDDLENLRAQMPGVRELTKIKGIGPSTVRLLHQRFRVRNVGELEFLARSGALLGMRRFGPEKTRELLHEIDVYRRRREKVPLHEALRSAEAVADELRALPGAVQVTVAGSSRRGKAMVGDLDVLVAADEARPFIEHLIHLPAVAEVLSTRDDGASVRLHSLRQVDLRVVPFECWGAALNSLTGSKMHNITLRGRFNRRGLKLTDRGIWNRADGRLVKPCRNEEEIYAHLGLAYVPPELREHHGELEAAERGRLPRLVSAEDLRGDLRVAPGADAEALEAYVQMATELGFEYLAFTPRGRSPEHPEGLRESQLLDVADHVRKLDETVDVHLLAGIEVDVLEDGTLAFDADFLRHFDWVIASVHAFADEEDVTPRLVRAMETGVVNVIGHPKGRLLGERPGPLLDFERLLDAARRHGVVLEVNGDPRRMDLGDLECRKAVDAGVRVALTSAAVIPRELGRRRYALASARRGWVEAKHVINALPYQDFRRLRDGQDIEDVALGEKATPGEGIERLVQRLQQGELDDDLTERLRRYLEEGADAELHTALGRLSETPLQAAFNLLTSRSGLPTQKA